MVGTAKSIGIFLSHFQQFFNIPTSLAAMVMGGSAIVYALMAPVCILLGQMFTIRKVMMIGGVIGFLGMSLGCLLFSIEYVIATFGICFGIGNATVYGNCLVILGLYFRQRRSLANGLALSGASIGQFALPPFFEFLLSNFGLQGCLLLVGGVYLHIVVAASLFRPTTFWKKKQERSTVKEMAESNGLMSPDGIKLVAFDSGQDGEAGSQVVSQADSHSPHSPLLPSTVQAAQEENASSLDRTHSRKSGRQTQNSAGQHLEQYSTAVSGPEPDRKQSGSSPVPRPEELKAENGCMAANHRGAGEDSCGPDTPQTPLVPPAPACPNGHDPARDRLASVGHSCSSLSGGGEDSDVRGCDAGHRVSNASLCIQPLYGSTINIEQLQADAGQEGDEEEGNKSLQSYCRQLLGLFDFSIMRSYVAILVTITNFLSFFGYFNFVLFLPAAMLTRGIEKYEKAIMVSVTGIGDLFGRLFMAAIADRDFIARYKLQALGVLLVGVNICLLIWADTYAWMTVHCALYGFFGGIHVSLSAVTIIDFVGMKHMPRLLAIVMLIQGLGASVGQPLLGGVRDATGSFQAVLVITGLCCIAGGAVLLAYPLALILEKRRPERFRLLPPDPSEDIISQ